jgi:hypothetical protein
MEPSQLAKKLVIKPGDRVLALDAPDDYLARLEPLPPGSEVASEPDGTFDVVHLFVGNAAALERSAPVAVAAVRPGGVLWVSYPKRSPGVSTDLSRDCGWAPLARAGLIPVSQVAVDDVWSALRFRPGSR